MQDSGTIWGGNKLNVGSDILKLLLYIKRGSGKELSHSLSLPAVDKVARDRLSSSLVRWLPFKVQGEKKPPHSQHMEQRHTSQPEQMEHRALCLAALALALNL